MAFDPSRARQGGSARERSRRYRHTGHASVSIYVDIYSVKRAYRHTGKSSVRPATDEALRVEFVPHVSTREAWRAHEHRVKMGFAVGRAPSVGSGSGLGLGLGLGLGVLVPGPPGSMQQMQHSSPLAQAPPDRLRCAAGAGLRQVRWSTPAGARLQGLAQHVARPALRVGQRGCHRCFHRVLPGERRGDAAAASGEVTGRLCGEALGWTLRWSPGKHP